MARAEDGLKCRKNDFTSGPVTDIIEEEKGDGLTVRTVGIGHQNFEKVRMRNIFYVDKTKFIKEWWESEDEVTLITRPRRFGKTLNMSMLEIFFPSNMPGGRSCLKGWRSGRIWHTGNFREPGRSFL